MKGVDTNVLVRYLTQDDPVQSRRASALIGNAASTGEGCRVASVVLCELVWVLRGAYGYGKGEIVSTLEKMLATVEFTIEDRDLAHRALDEYRDGAGDFADYLIGLKNRKAGCERTATFDHALRKCDLFEAP